MLTATQEEIDKVISYFESQAPDLTVEFAQKVHSENILGHRHEIWDVHTEEVTASVQHCLHEGVCLMEQKG